VKPDFKKLGPKYGKIMKAVAARLTSLPQADIAQLEKEGVINLDIDGQQASVQLADVEIISEDIPGWLVANEGNLTVALDVTLTPELQQEGVARELVNRIQNVTQRARTLTSPTRLPLSLVPMSVPTLPWLPTATTLPVKCLPHR